MLKKAWFGGNSIIVLAFHLLIVGADFLGWFQYFRTLFYPMFLFIAIMLAAVGLFERDKKKWPGIIGLLVGLGLLVHWIVMLVMRLKGA